MTKALKKMSLWSALLGLAFVIFALPARAAAQGDQDDPPSRVARLGYMEGSVSFQPAGEDDWVGAVSNRPLTTGDKLWADRDSRAELQLGSAVIRLSANTGISFLDLDDHTVQVQLSSGAINIRVRRLDGDDDFEIDTPNLAFTISQPGNYRVEASEDGDYTAVTIRGGEGEATGNGQTYTLHAGQTGTFDGTDSLDADVEQVGDPDQFDTWADGREHRYDSSRSAQYLSHDVVGYEDLDDNGDWRDDPGNGHVWFPHVAVGWAPYHEGHWAWIDPWGYTWVDDSPWGYAPFHYGRWVSVGGRWGWVAGPREVRAVYAPALVVFVGGGGGLGGNIAWFPLGPREVFVPSYHVSSGYMTQVNVSSTTVNTTTVTNVYNTTVINKTTTNITNVTYANRTVPGAVTAVPQHAFSSAQPVARVAVAVNAKEIAAAPVSARVAVNPTREGVLGGKASSAGHVAAPPAAVMNRQVVAKKTPPPPPVAFAKKQQAMAAHPGQPVQKREMATLRPAAAARPAVKVAPPGKPATATTGHPSANAARRGQPPASQPNAARPGQPAATANQPANRPGNQPAANERPGATPAQPNRPPAAQPKPEPNRPEANRTAPPPAHPPAAQPKPEPNRPEANRPPAAQPKPEPNRPEPSRPEANRPAPPPAHPPAAQPKPEPKPAPRPATPPPSEHPQQHAAPPAAAKPAPPKKEPAKPLTPEEKKRQEQQKPPGV